jgi:hypothetical protein
MVKEICLTTTIHACAPSYHRPHKKIGSKGFTQLYRAVWHQFEQGKDIILHHQVHSNASWNTIAQCGRYSNTAGNPKHSPCFLPQMTEGGVKEFLFSFCSDISADMLDTLLQETSCSLKTHVSTPFLFSSHTTAGLQVLLSLIN